MNDKDIMTIEKAMFILRHGSAEGLRKYLEAIAVIEKEYNRQKAEIERMRKTVVDLNANLTWVVSDNIDAVKVVRCKDCKYYSLHKLECCTHKYLNGANSIDGFCNHGERKE